MTQAQVGRMMEPPVGESAVSKMESGERRLTNLQLANLAAILRCQPEEIPVISGRDPAEGVRRWQRVQQEVVGSSIASGAAAAGYVLAQLRKKHGRTMQQVADAIDMTLSVYHRMEMASRMIQGDEIDKVAEFYGMTPETLIGLFEQRTAENLEQLKSGVPIEQLLPRVPRSLLKEGGKWGRLGALERYAMQRSIRYAGTPPAEPASLPVCGRMKPGHGQCQMPAILVDLVLLVGGLQPAVGDTARHDQAQEDAVPKGLAVGRAARAGRRVGGTRSAAGMSGDQSGDGSVTLTTSHSPQRSV